MADSLGRLLDKAPGAREVLPHLAALERALRETGVRAIAQVPVAWLGRIGSQLSSLPLPEDDPPLHELLERLMARVNARNGDWQADDLKDVERTVVIREISHSEFEAAADELAPTVFTPRL
jgi:hypothetical protein